MWLRFSFPVKYKHLAHQLKVLHVRVYWIRIVVFVSHQDNNNETVGKPFCVDEQIKYVVCSNQIRQWNVKQISGHVIYISTICNVIGHLISNNSKNNNNNYCNLIVLTRAKTCVKISIVDCRKTTVNKTEQRG